MEKYYVVISGIIRNEEGKILMLDHKKTGMWTIPVGKVEPGESIIDALYRELEEEVNIKVQGYESVNDFTRAFPQGETRTFVFNIERYTGEVKNNEPHKHLNMRWMAIEEIETLRITHATKGALEYLTKKDYALTK
jgi:8-oxo-dGTP diphosphatase